MQIEKLTFTGTPEEFQTVANLFDKTGDARQPRNGGENGKRATATVVHTTAESILLILTRMPPVPLGQKQLYKALYNAGDRGLTAKALTKRMGREGHFAGIMGALGTRVNYTKGIEGKPGVTLLFDIQQVEDGQLHYRMKPELRKALETLNPDWLT